MAFPGAARAGRLACRIDVQDKTGDLAPIRAFRFRIKEPQVCNKVLFVVGRQSLDVWGRVGHGWIERRLSHEMSYKRRRAAIRRQGPSSISDAHPPNRSNILSAVFDRMITLQENPL
jgi:hypothetical protein